MEISCTPHQERGLERETCRRTQITNGISTHDGTEGQLCEGFLDHHTNLLDTQHAEGNECCGGDGEPSADRPQADGEQGEPDDLIEKVQVQSGRKDSVSCIATVLNGSTRLHEPRLSHCVILSSITAFRRTESKIREIAALRSLWGSLPGNELCGECM